jgi:hypothetical protein
MAKSKRRPSVSGAFQRETSPEYYLQRARSDCQCHWWDSALYSLKWALRYLTETDGLYLDCLSLLALVEQMLGHLGLAISLRKKVAQLAKQRGVWLRGSVL